LVADIAAEAPDVHVEQQEMTHMVRRWIDAMPIKQRIVILRRFGLDHGTPATLDEIADELGVTRERVRQIQQDGLHRLKQVIAARGVRKDALL
jgi:RNA polymerase nonessential primary-like sigma factor